MKTLNTHTFRSSFANLGADFCQPVSASALPNARLVDISEDCAHLLGLSLPNDDVTLLTAICAGQQTLAGMKPVAALYAGHQFGL